MTLIAKANKMLGIKPILHDFRQVERQWVDHVLNAPSHELGDLGKHVAKKVGGVRIKEMEGDAYQALTGKSTLSNVKRLPIPFLPTKIAFNKSTELSIKNRLMPFIEAFQHGFRRLRLSLLFPSHWHAQNAFKQIEAISDNVLQGLNPEAASKQVNDVLKTMSPKALRQLKKLNLLSIQSSQLSLKHADKLSLESLDYVSQTYLMQQRQQVNLMIRKIEQGKKGLKLEYTPNTEFQTQRRLNFQQLQSVPSL